MTKISSLMLQDTLSLVQLARECALANGKDEQADKLSPVVNDLKQIVVDSNKTLEINTTATSELSNDEGFQALLNVATTRHESDAGSSTMSSHDRNKIVIAMAAGEMSEVDIARRMGITREEVRLIINVNQRKVI